MKRFSIIWHKLSTRIKATLINHFAKQTNYDIKNTVLLVGSSRSGTTFLLESLNQQNDFRLIFEPFNPTYTKEWQSFSARHYIRKNAPSEIEKRAVEFILSGRIRNYWVDQFNRKMISEKRLIKSIRAHFMLDYFEHAYPQMKIIFVYRNPYGQVASRMSLNFDPKDVHLALAHPPLMKEYYQDINPVALEELLSTTIGCHSVLWCLENRFILQTLQNRNIQTVRYEDVIGKSVSLKNGVLHIQNKPRRASVTTSRHPKYHLTIADKKVIIQVLRLFEMESFIH